MARTAEGAALTAQHHQSQLQVRARALQDFIRLWPLWEGDGSTFQRLVLATVPLVLVYRRLSSALAGSYYEAFRSVEQPGGSPTPRQAEAIDEDALRGTLFVTGADMTRRAVLAGQSPEEAMNTALVRTSGTVSRFVLEGGRETVVRSTAADRRAKGWARVTDSQPCAFCAMLASRGPVYSEDTSDFQAHDHCGCGGEPVYAGSEWPGRAREFKRLWNEHASSAENPLQEFRRVLDGRAS